MGPIHTQSNLWLMEHDGPINPVGAQIKMLLLLFPSSKKVIQNSLGEDSSPSLVAYSSGEPPSHFCRETEISSSKH